MLETIGQHLQSDGEKKTHWPGILSLYLVETSFKNDGEMKTIPVKQKLRELIASNILRMLKRFLQAGGQCHWMEAITRKIHHSQKCTILYTKDHPTMAWEPSPAC